MKNTRLLLSSACIAIGLSLPVLAEPTNAELDQRLRAVEGNISAILELLQAQQGAAASPVSSADATETQTVPTPAGYRWGALYYDVFSVAMSQDEANAIKNGKRQLAEAAPDVPLASSIIVPAEKFDWGFVRANKETSPYAMADGNLQVQWSGVLEIQKVGDHTFSLQLSGNSTPVNAATACRSVMRLNETVIVDASWNGNSWDAFNVNRQGKEVLEPGVYDFSIFLTCIGGREEAFKSTNVSIRFLEPGDRAPKAIPPDRFGIRM